MKLYILAATCEASPPPPEPGFLFRLSSFFLFWGRKQPPTPVASTPYGFKVREMWVLDMCCAVDYVMSVYSVCLTLVEGLTSNKICPCQNFFVIIKGDSEY